MSSNFAPPAPPPLAAPALSKPAVPSTAPQEPQVRQLSVLRSTTNLQPSSTAAAPSIISTPPPPPLALPSRQMPAPSMALPAATSNFQFVSSVAPSQSSAFTKHTANSNQPAPPAPPPPPPPPSFSSVPVAPSPVPSKPIWTPPTSSESQAPPPPPPPPPPMLGSSATTHTTSNTTAVAPPPPSPPPGVFTGLANLSQSSPAPPPPPPPPPPPNDTSLAGNSLAAQLAAAKLKKTSPSSVHAPPAVQESRTGLLAEIVAGKQLRRTGLAEIAVDRPQAVAPLAAEIVSTKLVEAPSKFRPVCICGERWGERRRRGKHMVLFAFTAPLAVYVSPFACSSYHRGPSLNVHLTLYTPLFFIYFPACHNTTATATATVRYGK